MYLCRLIERIEMKKLRILLALVACSYWEDMRTHDCEINSFYNGMRINIPPDGV